MIALTTLKYKLFRHLSLLPSHEFLHVVVVVYSLSHVQLFAVPRTVAWQAPLSMRFPWSGLPFPSPGDLPNPGIEPMSPALLVDSLPSELPVKVKVTQLCLTLCNPMDYIVHGILQARILEWVAFPFSRGSSQPRDRTHVSCIAGGFFTSWATREALYSHNWRFRFRDSSYVLKS